LHNSEIVDIGVDGFAVAFSNGNLGVNTSASLYSRQYEVVAHSVNHVADHLYNGSVVYTEGPSNLVCGYNIFNGSTTWLGASNVAQVSAGYDYSTGQWELDYVYNWGTVIHSEPHGSYWAASGADTL
jgi:hypothetical protein